MDMGMCMRLNGTAALMALGLGYIVCYLANREEKNLRKVGYVIGIFMIITSCLLILAKAAWMVKGCSKMGPACSMMMREQGPEMPLK